MILLKKIKIHNLFSHKDTELELKEDEKILIDGKSGSGKSSIVESVLWGLYGIARVDNRSLVRKGQKNAFVILHLQDEKVSYIVKRETTEKAKNTLAVSVSQDGKTFQAIGRTGMKDIQDWIENTLLHASYELFVNSVAYPQDNINNFVRQPASKRKDLLLEVVKTIDFATTYEKSRTALVERITNKEVKLKAIELSNASIRVNAVISEKVEVVEKEMTTVKSTVEGLRRSVQQLTEFSNTYTTLMASSSRLGNEILRANHDNGNRVNQINELKTTISAIKLIDIENAKKNLALLNTKREQFLALEKKMREVMEFQSKMNEYISNKPSEIDYERDIERLNKQLIPLIKDSGRCPAGDKCPFVTPIKNQIAFFEEQIKERESAKTRQSKQLEAYAEGLSKIPRVELSKEEYGMYEGLKNEIGYLTGFETVVVRYEMTLQKNEEYEAQIKIIEDAIKEENKRKQKSQEELDGLLKQVSSYDISGVDERIASEKKNLALSENSLSALTRDHEAALIARRSIEREKDSIKQYEKELLVLEEEIDCLLLIKDAFSQKGIKTVLIDYLIPTLEDRVNEILSDLSDFKIRFETQRSTADGESTIEGLFIEIFNDRGELHDFDAYSGGERLKIVVAISEALATLQRVGFRIFDELFTAFDEESLEHFASIMEKLQGRFKQILCISHLRTIKDMFGKKIEVVKLNGTSIIK